MRFDDDAFLDVLRQCELDECKEALTDGEPAQFSDGFEERMRELCLRMKTGKFRRIYGSARTALIAAAAAILMASTVLAAILVKPVIFKDDVTGVYHVDGALTQEYFSDFSPRIPERFGEKLYEKTAGGYFEAAYGAEDGATLVVLVEPAANDRIYDAKRPGDGFVTIDDREYYLITDGGMMTLIYADAFFRYEVEVWDDSEAVKPELLADIIKSMAGETK